MKAPLESVRVLDLSRLLPGPYCSLLLADMGADVIKIEAPAGGDYARFLPPMVGNMSVAFAALNRGKRSAVLNLKSGPGLEAFLALAEAADVVIESFRPGVMDRIGCGWSVLKEHNPKLVYCAISGYGQAGPDSQRAGHDINYLALSGALSHNARRQESPVVPGFQAADVTGATVAALRIVAALLARQSSGQGAFVDVSLTESVASLVLLTAVEEYGGGVAIEPGTGTLAGGRPFYDVYPTADGEHMALGALEPKFWLAFCQLVERPDWVALQYSVGEPRDKLRSEVRALFSSRTRAQWEALCATADACCEPVLSLAEALERPAAGRGQSRLMAAPGDGAETPAQLRSPVMELDQEPAPWRSAPGHGEHTEEVLREAGLRSELISALC